MGFCPAGPVGVLLMWVCRGVVIAWSGEMVISLFMIVVCAWVTMSAFIGGVLLVCMCSIFGMHFRCVECFSI